MSTTRTDTHRPSAIVPADYEYVACEVVSGPEYDNLGVASEMRAVLRAHKAQTGGAHCSHKDDSGFCDVCGSVNLIYGIIFYHVPSNEYVRVGEDCARKLELGGTRQFNAFKKSVRDAIEAQAGKRKAQAILANAGLSALWDIAMAQDRKGFKYEELTITDIVGKLIRYGSVSEKALAFAARLHGKIADRAGIEAKRAAEQEAAANCPTGRVIVTGTVLSTKWQESDFGGSMKMLVRDDSGFKVWCTIPSSENVEKGDKITFTVSVEPSRDDPKFGFGKRPAKLRNLTAKAQQVETDLVEPAPRDEVNVPDVASNRDDYYAS